MNTNLILESLTEQRDRIVAAIKALTGGRTDRTGAPTNDASWAQSPRSVSRMLRRNGGPHRREEQPESEKLSLTCCFIVHDVC